MKKTRKIALLAACGLSALSLASCGDIIEQVNTHEKDEISDVSSSTGDSYNNGKYNYVIVCNDEKPDILYNITSYKFKGYNKSHASTNIFLNFTTSNKKNFLIKDNWYMFEEKPSQLLYDIEYGSKEWEDSYNGENASTGKYIIVNNPKADFLIKFDSYKFTGYKKSDESTNIFLALEANGEKIMIKDNWVMYEEKPPKALYDIEYGSKEWVESYSYNYTSSQQVNSTDELLRD